MIRIKSLHLGKTIGLKKIAFLRFMGCQNRFMIYTVTSWFWQHQTIQKFVVAVKIASWFVKLLHDFDSIRLCKNQLFSKITLLALHTKTQVSSQNFSQPNLITKIRSSLNLYQHNHTNISLNLSRITIHHEWPIFIKTLKTTTS